MILVYAKVEINTKSVVEKITRLKMTKEKTQMNKKEIAPFALKLRLELDISHLEYIGMMIMKKTKVLNHG